MQSDYRWDSQIVEKYATNGPRYTSYPTANLFTEEFGEASYLAESAGFQNCEDPLSLYVHIPFCEKACFYCGCNRVITRDRAKIRRYLDGVFTEIQLLGKLHGHRKVRQLHLGGGTPSYLDPPEMTELMHHLATSFELDDRADRDFAIELDPRTIDEHSIALYKGLGFNRLSLGIQDFDSTVQRAINRVQSFSNIELLTKQIRDYGFSSLNFDLIYGLPNQNVETMGQTIQQVIDLKPDRIACYNYAHMPERFPAQQAIASSALPSSTEKLALLELIGTQLTANGYTHIGLDHFALEKDELCKAAAEGNLKRNFQGYSLDLASDLVGIGASAISELAGCFSQNEKEIEPYLDKLKNHRLPISKGLRLTKSDVIRAQIIQLICCELALPTKDLEETFGISFKDEFSEELTALKGFEEDGLVRWQGPTLRVTETGRLVLRNICMLFDQYLQIKSKPNFSKVI